MEYEKEFTRERSQKDIPLEQSKSFLSEITLLGKNPNQIFNVLQINWLTI